MQKIKPLIYLLALILFDTACSTVNYIRVNERVIYADSPSKNVSVHCTKEDPENKNSFTYLYLFENNRVDEFVYRRPWSYQDCLSRKASIQSILDSNIRVRVAGMHGSKAKDNKLEADDSGYLPKALKGKPHFVWFFERLEGNKKCHGYFTQSCDGRPFSRLGKGWEIESP